MQQDLSTVWVPPQDPEKDAARSINSTGAPARPREGRSKIYQQYGCPARPREGCSKIYQQCACPARPRAEHSKTYRQDTCCTDHRSLLSSHGHWRTGMPYPQKQSYTGMPYPQKQSYPQKRSIPVLLTPSSWGCQASNRLPFPLPPFFFLKFFFYCPLLVSPSTVNIGKK